MARAGRPGAAVFHAAGCHDFRVHSAPHRPAAFRALSRNVAPGGNLSGEYIMTHGHAAHKGAGCVGCGGPDEGREQVVTVALTPWDTQVMMMMRNRRAPGRAPTRRASPPSLLCTHCAQMALRWSGAARTMDVPTKGVLLLCVIDASDQVLGDLVHSAHMQQERPEDTDPSPRRATEVTRA
eukprot:Tamp_20422.p1 GENE.Tamp_20422~~Tamp_20422.p1  ORF type:complete len:181 (-),score=9.71 Tamp_20422:483-1025(-)